MDMIFPRDDVLLPLFKDIGKFDLVCVKINGLLL
jgi:hypothetical protein